MIIQTTKEINGLVYDYTCSDSGMKILRDGVEYDEAFDPSLRFKDYWLKYKNLHDSIPADIKTQIIMGIKNRMYAEGMVLETLTFNEWIKQVEVIV